jgi:hypothetical protein
MNVASHRRGTPLLSAHVAALEPGAATARERLDEALGEELARKLVFALSGGAAVRQRADGGLADRAVFAA